MKTSTQHAHVIADAVAWKSLKNLIERFRFDIDEARILMGDMPLSTFYKGINKFEGKLSKDEKCQ